jgi:HAMP domain-containing protein
MTAVDVLFAAAYLLLVGCAARWILRRQAERRARRRARLFRDVAAYRAWRLAPPRIDTTPGDPYSDLRIEAELIATASRKEQIS